LWGEIFFVKVQDCWTNIQFTAFFVLNFFIVWHSEARWNSEWLWPFSEYCCGMCLKLD